ncbi:hypothetical protein CCACVL1_12841 [Corchorus capsularis]|uniref:tRNA-uridine aminocarboxypropyltransferase n=1 Tax=Corchorus capsularis TaxID=210143 RepID=A0A1R3IDE4_COCAP|nr:hypothetical protein CCACVL1_12841 [Corchorus capsularis]
MSTTQSKPKRPMCPSCSKPARTCLCSRIRTRDLDNSVELESSGFGQVGGKKESLEVGCGSFNFGVEGNDKCPDEKSGDLIEKYGEFSLENGVSRCGNAGNSLKALDFEDNIDVPNGDEPLLELSGRECGGVKGSLAMENPCETLSNLDATVLTEDVSDERSGFDQNGAVSMDREEAAIDARIIKYGCIADLSHIWKLEIQGKKPKFDHILSSPLARDALAGGFVVKKFERRKVEGKIEVEEIEEFQVKIPPGSILLFPSQTAVGVDDLKSMDFEVKNLIVLDGTWSKAGRIYNENPWLKLLPHLRLDLAKMSLYNEIRCQPKAGYLSTIESIVYTLKALGDNDDGLDNLLDVFESMVGDQRRLKEERLSKGGKQ